MAKAFDFDRLIDQLAQGRNEEIEVQSCKQLSFALGTGIRRLKKREIELNEIQRESRANIKELQDKRSRIEQLEGIVTDKKRIEDLLLDSRQQNEFLRSNLVAKDEEIRKLTEAACEQEERILQLEREANNLREAREQLGMAKEEKTRTNEELAIRQTEVATLSANLKEAQNTCNTEIQKVVVLAQSVAVKDQEITRLRAEIADGKKIDDIVEKLSSLTLPLQISNDRNKELNNVNELLKCEKEVLQQMRQTSLDENGKLEGNITLMTQEIKLLQREIAELKERIKGLLNIEEKNTGLQLSIEKIKKEQEENMARLQQQVETLEGINRGHEQRIDNLREVKSSLERQIDTLKKQSQDSQQQIITLKKTNDNLQQLVSTVERGNQDFRQQVDALKETNGTLQQQVNALQEKTQDFQQRMDSLKEINDNSQQEINALEEKNRGLGQEVNALETTNTNTQRRVVNLEDKNDNLEQHITHLKKDIIGFQQQINGLQEKEADLKEQVDSLNKKEENFNLKGQVERLLNDKTSMGNEMAALQKQVESLKRQLPEKKDDLPQDIIGRDAGVNKRKRINNANGEPPGKKKRADIAEMSSEERVWFSNIDDFYEVLQSISPEEGFTPNALDMRTLVDLFFGNSSSKGFWMEYINLSPQGVEDCTEAVAYDVDGKNVCKTECLHVKVVGNKKGKIRRYGNMSSELEVMQ